MNILIAVVAASESLSGVTRHAANMARCLLTRDDVSAVHLIVAPWQYDALDGAITHRDARLFLHRVSLRNTSVARNLWYLRSLPRLAAQFDADIVHLAYPVPVRRNAFACPVVVTLHDLYPCDIPANFGFPKVLFNRAVLEQCLRAVDVIACVSRSTLQRLEVHLPQLAIEKALTIYNCVEPGPPIAQQSPLPGWDGEPFLLCVAQHRRNKNIPLALEVFRRLLLSAEIHPSTRFVLIGIEGPETPHILRFLRDARLEDRVTLLHGVDDPGLHWCYRHCDLLLAPSLTEGFGVPIVEAMFHQRPIACSDIPAFREVGGAYCHYATLDLPPLSSPDAFVQAARLALRQTSFRPPLVEQFSASSIAEAYLQLFTHLRMGCTIPPRVHHAPVAIVKRGQL